MLRRTRAILELMMSIFILVIFNYAWGDDETDSEFPVSLSSYWFGIGAVSAVVYQWVYDRDIAGIRRSRYRRAIVSVGWTALTQKFLSKEETAAWSFSNGGLVGGIVYRFWYGLLRPLPGPD